MEKVENVEKVEKETEEEKEDKDGLGADGGKNPPKPSARSRQRGAKRPDILVHNISLLCLVTSLSYSVFNL